ncbi:tyrosine-type recombinase/integrase [Candidatus Pacearchaeota archaeon]|nr:tyrosine-type recombinase/integrase [Candidatus Pacearchaeota archaeon]
MVDIHNYKKRLEGQLRLVMEDEKILPKNRETILKFKDYLVSEGIGLPKISRYFIDLRKLSKMLGKNFEDANKDDIRRVVSELNMTDLTEESKKVFKVAIRKLYRFVRGVEEKLAYPDEVKWISIAIPKSKGKLPEELLTEEEIKATIRNCGNVRDRALISTLAESGCRIGEIGNLQIKHVSFEQYGARITVSGKTGMRKILVINSAPYLKEWINQHPLNDNPDATLWHNNRKSGFLTYARIKDILKRSAKKAGIKKRVYPHLLRHSRATCLASIMSESQMKNYLGWEQSSKMAGIYVHMSGKDTDMALLKANGVAVKEEEHESKIKPIKCMKCGEANPFSNRFCNSCGFVLEEKGALEIIKKDYEKESMNNFLSELMKDKDVLELFNRKINEMRINNGR